MIDIEKIKQAALAATKTPWEFWQGYVATDIDSDGGVIICERPRPSGGKFQKSVDNNFKFIATANPQVVIELITRLESAERGLSTYTEMYNRVYDELQDANQEIERLEWIISLHPAIDPSVIAPKKV